MADALLPVKRGQQFLDARNGEHEFLSPAS